MLCTFAMFYSSAPAKNGGVKKSMQLTLMQLIRIFLDQVYLVCRVWVKKIVVYDGDGKKLRGLKKWC